MYFIYVQNLILLGKLTDEWRLANKRESNVIIMQNQ